jgi:iron complex transport system substrate-binding protein
VHAPRHSERSRRGRISGLSRAARIASPVDFRSSARHRSFALLATLSALVACRPAPARIPSSSASPRRVVALAPNLTEIVFALGAGSSLVGVSEYSDYPPEARAIPRVGGLEVSAEKVASLSPDLVLATREGNARGPVSVLAGAGLRVVALPTGSLDAVLESIRRTGDALGCRVRAERLVEELSRRRAAVRARISGQPRPNAILLVWPDPPQAAGGGTFLHDVLSEAGAENRLAGRPGWPIVSAEYLATTPVDVLVLPSSPETKPPFERALASGALSRGAARRSRVVWIDEAVLTRPGPRVFDALEELAGALHPEAPGPRRVSEYSCRWGTLRSPTPPGTKDEGPETKEGLLTPCSESGVPTI